MTSTVPLWGRNSNRVDLGFAGNAAVGEKTSYCIRLHPLAIHPVAPDDLAFSLVRKTLMLRSTPSLASAYSMSTVMPAMPSAPGGGAISNGSVFQGCRRHRRW
jgi:hypothetical protein